MFSHILILLVPLGVFGQAPVTLINNPAVEVAIPVNSQYHSQDTSGQYSYGYSNGESSKEESRSSDGVTRGSYSYVDANGVLQSVSYEADAEHGFRVAATNLPVATSLQYNPQPNNEVILLKKIQSAAGNLNELPAKEKPVAENIQANDTKGKYTLQKDDENESEQTIVRDSEKNDISTLNTLTSFPGRIHHQNTNEKSFDENNNRHVNNGDTPLSFIRPLAKISPGYTPLTYSSSFNNELLIVNQFPKYSYNNNEFWNRINYMPLIRRDDVYRLPSPYMIYDGVEPLLRQQSFVPTGLSNTQYHLQNGRGDYLYGYNNQLSAKEEKRGIDGVTRGFYSYPNAYGQLQTVSYVADDVHGFNSVSSSLPHWPLVVPINK